MSKHRVCNLEEGSRVAVACWKSTGGSGGTLHWNTKQIVCDEFMTCVHYCPHLWLAGLQPEVKISGDHSLVKRPGWPHPDKVSFKANVSSPKGLWTVSSKSNGLKSLMSPPSLAVYPLIFLCAAFIGYFTGTTALTVCAQSCSDFNSPHK